MKLKDIANIRSGYLCRRRVEPVEDGTHGLVQIKDIDKATMSLSLDTLCRIKPRGNPGRYQVSAGDVLFLSRGPVNVAINVGLVPACLLASACFHILTPKNDLVLSKYLAWFLNQRPAKVFLNTIGRRGSRMPVVPKSVFEQMDIAVPGLGVQSDIVALVELRVKERELAMEIERRRDELIASVCLNKAGSFAIGRQGLSTLQAEASEGILRKKGKRSDEQRNQSR